MSDAKQAEIAAAMVYYYGWDRLDARTHVRVGWIYFVSAWASLATRQSPSSPDCAHPQIRPLQ